MLLHARPACQAACLALAVLVPDPARAAALLTAAQADIRFLAAIECEVALTVTVTGATDVTEAIEHRLELLEGASVRLVALERAVEARPAQDIGRTRTLVVAPAAGAPQYVLRYRIQQARSRPGRCPIWLPTVPTDGRSRSVRVTIDLPDGQTASGTMPTFAWQGTRGTAVLAHLPAFVIVPFADAGAPRPWDIARVMDAVALASLAVASAVWLRRRKGAH